MAAISNVYADLINKIKTDAPEFKFVHIWNNQLDQLADGSTYTFPLPCCFIEVSAPTEYKPLLRGYSVSNLIVRIHIGHEEYDAYNGNFEENFNVFTFRDKIINILNNYQPVACSSMMKSSESQDYTHTNIYHYVVEFVTAFVDSKGSFEEQNALIDAVIEDIEVDAQIVANLELTFDNTFDNTFQ